MTIVLFFFAGGEPTADASLEDIIDRASDILSPRTAKERQVL
jgi:hypothetical protein